MKTTLPRSLQQMLIEGNRSDRIFQVVASICMFYLKMAYLNKKNTSNQLPDIYGVQLAGFYYFYSVYSFEK